MIRVFKEKIYVKFLQRVFSYILTCVCLCVCVCGQSFGSQQWDTGFALQALLASDMSDEIGETLAKGHDFVKKSQVPYIASFRYLSLFCDVSSRLER